MEKAEWLKECAARFQSRAGMTEGEAAEQAELCFDFFEGDLTVDPEAAADEEISCWSE